MGCHNLWVGRTGHRKAETTSRRIYYKINANSEVRFFLQPLFVNMLAIDQFSPAVNLMRAYLATITLIPLSSTTYQNEFLQITRNRRKTEGYLCPRKQITDGE